MAREALPGLRPAAAPPGGRARARCGAQRAFRRSWLYGCRGIPAPCSLRGTPAFGRCRRPHLRAALFVRFMARSVRSDETGFTAAGASLPPAAFAALRPSAAAAGRTSGRPCSCALWRAACVQTNRRSVTAGFSTVGLLGMAGSLEPALIASAGRMPKRASMERPEGRRAPIRRRRIGRAGSVRETGTGRPEPASPATLRASGEMTRATPSLRRLALPGPKMGWACIPADFRHI
jgi:hypothetical protein